MQLTLAQEEAKNFIDGQALLIACPGSGKTTTVIERAIHMVESGINPESMLTITFTKAAADEMLSRFQNKCNARAKFSTIHSFCYQILSKRYGYKPEDIMKQSEEWMFIADKFREQGEAPNKIEGLVKEVMSGISYTKNNSSQAKEYKVDLVRQSDFLRIFERYEEYKNSLGKIDFDDMLIVFRDKLLSDDTLLKELKGQYKYITIDEFQDTNKIQADIFYMIAGDNGNIFVVGDDDQSIYAFRAAKSGIMLDFPKRYPKCKIINLDTNYRSGKQIISAASRLIGNNTQRFNKDFKAGRDIDGNIVFKKYNSVPEESESIVAQIKEMAERKVDYNSMAILFRTNLQAVMLVTNLVKNKIPFYATEKIPGIHEDPIFNDIKAYYRLAEGIDKKGDLQRILNKPGRYLKSESFKNCSFNKEELFKAASDLKPFAKEKIIDMIWDIQSLKGRSPKEFMSYLNSIMGYRNWLKESAEYFGKEESEFLNVFDVLEDEASSFSTMKEWLEYSTWYEQKIKQAAKKENREGVCLSTFHGAKGLEWETVFIIDANEGICPYKKAETAEEIEEERRMFYVAMTRAKDNLQLCYCMDVAKNINASRFLIECQS